MLIDISKLHSKTILTIDGPVKQFPTKEGTREKYNITFTDGYKAEYCPLVGSTQKIPSSGQLMTFKVRHRGNMGDEIELAMVEQTEPSSSISKGIVSMNGHPASIALSTAIRLMEINKKPDSGKAGEVMSSDVLDTAEIFYDWLLMKANGV